MEDRGAKPRIFISYSHDMTAHKQSVLSLSERLRKDGIETALDQYVNGTPAEKWPRWMLNQIDWAEFILLVCTETYYRRFRGHEEPGKGKGVDWEGAVISQEIYDARSATIKFVPVLFDATDERFIPEPVRGHTFYVLKSEQAYKDLYDFLLDQGGAEPGPVGEPTRKPRVRAKPLVFGEEGGGLGHTSVLDHSTLQQIPLANVDSGAREDVGRNDDQGQLDKLVSRPEFIERPEGQERIISSENSIDPPTPPGNRAIDPSLSAVPPPPESALFTPEKPSCYVLITEEKSFLRQIVEELKKHPELKGKIKHQEPQVRTDDDPDKKTKMNDEDYAKFLVGFFAAEASQYKWLVTNLPWQQERYFVDVIFEKFAKAEDKFCILIESGHGIPDRWKSWKAEHKWCQRSSFPFLVIETNHQEAAAQLIERAAAKGILPLRVDKLAVLSLFPPKDRSADTRASIYHECFGPQLSVGDQDGTGRNMLSVSAPNFNFFRWEVEGFDRRQTADALRRNKKALDAARDADHMLFFCGNDEMAEEIVQFMSPRGPRHVGTNRHSKYTIFGFDGSVKQEAISNTGFHFLTAAPNLEAMCGCAANFIADPDARICAEDPCRRISAKEPLWFKPSLG